MDLVNWVFLLQLNTIAIILIEDLFNQYCRIYVSSRYLIYSRVITQKSVFKTLYGSYKFLIIFFRVINASIRNSLLLAFSLLICDQFIELFYLWYYVIFQSDREHAEYLVILLHTFFQE